MDQLIKATPRSRVSSAPKKRAIVEAALLLFGERGYDGVALRDIARAAGLPLSTLAHHFRDKQSLYDAAVTRAFESSAALFLDASSGAGPINERLRHVLEQLIPFIARPSPEQKLVDRALLDGHVLPSLAPSPVLDQNREQLRRFFTQVAADNQLNYDWDELSELFVGFMYGLVKFRDLHARIVSERAPSEDSRFVKRLVDFFLAGVHGMS